MKSFCIIILLFISGFQFIWGQDVEQAIKYNDAIIEQNEKILVEFENLIRSYDKYIAKEMDSAYNATLLKVKEGIAFIEKIKPFMGDTTFKKGALSLFKTYLSTLEVEHKRIIELLKLPEKDYGEKEVNEYEKLINTFNTKLEEEFNKLLVIQKKFAETHNFKISENNE